MQSSGLLFDLALVLCSIRFVCVCSSLCIWVQEHKSSVSSLVTFPFDLDSWSLGGHSWPECFHPVQQDSVEVQTMIRTPQRLFKGCSADEQGNKPPFSELNWAMNPAELFHTLLFSLCSLYSLTAFYLSGPIILQPFESFCWHPSVMGVEWCSLWRLLDQSQWKCGSLQAVKQIAVLFWPGLCVASMEAVYTFAILGG